MDSQHCQQQPVSCRPGGPGGLDLDLDLGAVERLCQEIFREREDRLDRLRKDSRRRRQTNRANLGRQQQPKLEQLEQLEQQQQVTTQAAAAAAGKRRCTARSRPPSFQDAHVLQLDRLLGHLSDSNNWHPMLELFASQFHSVQRGLLHVLFARAQRGQKPHQYQLVHSVIERMSIREVPIQWLQEIEDIWNNASYHLEGQPGEMTPVKRYRIRNRLECPTSVVVGKRRYRIDEKSERLMRELYQRDPRPRRDQKLLLHRETGLPYETVTNWFKNRRQRDKKKKQQQQLAVAKTKAKAPTDQREANRRGARLEVAPDRYGSQASYTPTQTSTTTAATTAATNSSQEMSQCVDRIKTLFSCGEVADDHDDHDHDYFGFPDEALFYDEQMLFDPIKEEKPKEGPIATECEYEHDHQKEEVEGRDQVLPDDHQHQHQHQQPHLLHPHQRCLTPLEILGHQNYYFSQAAATCPSDQSCCCMVDYADHHHHQDNNNNNNNSYYYYIS